MKTTLAAFVAFVLVLPGCSITKDAALATKDAKEAVAKVKNWIDRTDGTLTKIGAAIENADKDGDGKLSLTEILAGIGTLGAGGLVLHRATTRQRHAANSKSNPS